MAVTAYFTSQQLLLFVFARPSVCHYSMAEENPAAQRQTAVKVSSYCCLSLRVTIVWHVFRVVCYTMPIFTCIDMNIITLYNTVNLKDHQFIAIWMKTASELVFFPFRWAVNVAYIIIYMFFIYLTCNVKQWIFYVLFHQLYIWPAKANSGNLPLLQ